MSCGLFYYPLINQNFDLNSLIFNEAGKKPKQNNPPQKKNKTQNVVALLAVVNWFRVIPVCIRVSVDLHCQNT